MHLYIITRGIKSWSDQFITELQGQYVRFKYPTDPKEPTKLNDCNLQVAVRPIQLYEIAFPEDQKDIILTTILGKEQGDKSFVGYGGGKTTQHKKHEKWLWGIRKILGAQPVPAYKTDLAMPITRQNIEVVGVGIKKDYWQDCRDGKRYDHKANEFCFEGI